MAKKSMKKQPPPPPPPPLPPSSSSSSEESPPSISPPKKKLSAISTAAVLRKHTDPSKPADGKRQEAKEESSEERNNDGTKPKKMEKPSATEEEEFTEEESSEDSGNAARQTNPLTQSVNDGKQKVSKTSSFSYSGSQGGEEEREDLNSRSKLEQPLPPVPPQTGQIADHSLKPPSSSKSMDGEEEGGEGFETEGEESTAVESSEDFCITALKENPLTQRRDSQNTDDDKQASKTSSSSGSDLGNDEEEIEAPISGASLEPLSNKLIDSSAQPVEKEHNSGKQSAASPVSKKKGTAGIVGADGGPEKERFRRIWSNEDEMALLHGILEYKERHHVIPSSHIHAEPLLKYVKDSLSISVSANQINDKVRRMKKRYNNTTTRQNHAKKSKFSDPHNAAVFNLSKKIWESLEEPIFLENKITLEKKLENINNKERELNHFTEVYPSLYRHLKSEHANTALLLQNHIPIANAKKLEEKCKELEKIDIELNLLKIDFLSSAVKLIMDAHDKW